MNTLQVRRFGLRIGKILASKVRKPKKTYFQHRVAEYRRIWTHAAEACGAQLVELAPDLWRAERQGVRVHLCNHIVQLDDPVTLIMAGRKPLMHSLLSDAGLDVPVHSVFTLQELSPAMEFLRSHPDGVVVKPANGSAAGDGVSTHLTTEREVRNAAVLASLYDSQILIEALVPGESYRALVVGGQMLHAVCRRGPRVVADGRHTVRELIEEVNTGRGPRGRPIEVDADCLFTLGWQGLGPDHVPPEGAEVLLKAVESYEGGDREVRTVYNATVTDGLCPSIRTDVEAAARVLASDFVGVDFITTDPSVPFSESGGCINEVNTTPALHHHYESEKELFPTAAADVLDFAIRRRAKQECS